MALPPQPEPAPAAPAAPPAPAALPPAQPASAAEPARPRRSMVLTGGILGLIVGLGVGYDLFRQQPAVYESTAVVSGSDAAEVKTPAVLDRAARRLDALRPFAPPLPETVSERIAYVTDHLTARRQDGAVHLSFRGPNPADTAKYLKALTEAYVAGGTPRPQPAPPLPPPPGAKTAPAEKAGPKAPTAPSPSPVDPDARVTAERRKLQDELAAVTGEDLTAIEARVAKNRAALAATRGKLKDADRDLAAITAAGTDKGKWLALMRQFGVTPDPEAPVVPSAEEKEWAGQLVALQRKKAELGRRLGPEHRDMVALDEQIRYVREELAQAKPKGPAADALDRFRDTLQKRWAALNTEAAGLAEAVQRDEATLEAAAPIRARLDALAGRQPAPPQPFPVPLQPEPAPKAVTTAPPAPAPAPAAPSGPEVLQSPAEGVRVSPVLSQWLVPGGAIGLVAGLGLGFVASLVSTAWANRPRRERKAAVAPPKPVVISGTTRRAATQRVAKYDGPPLGVPVLGQVPELRLDLPVEKKSVEGWSPALVSFARPNGSEADAYRTARRSLVEELGSAGHKAVVVTSPGDGDGKTTTAANLAISLAQSGKRVLLIDCDYRGTKQQELFRLTRLGDSLKSVLLNDVDLRVAVRPCEVANLFLLPAGRNPVDAVDLLTRAKFKDLVAELKGQYEYVLLDAPPTTAERELKGLAEQADGVVLVVRGGPDAKERADRATSEVARAGSKVIGAVVTAAPVRPTAPQGDPASATAV